MKSYLYELNEKTREELHDAILFEVRCRDSRVDNVHLYKDDLIGEICEIYFHNKDGFYFVKLIPNFVLRDLYASIEKQGVQFDESNINLWLALFRDLIVEKIYELVY